MLLYYAPVNATAIEKSSAHSLNSAYRTINEEQSVQEKIHPFNKSKCTTHLNPNTTLFKAFSSISHEAHFSQIARVYCYPTVTL